jgi:hypothetical protein
MKPIRPFALENLTRVVKAVLALAEWEQYQALLVRLEMAEKLNETLRADRKSWHQHRAAWKRKHDLLEKRHENLKHVVSRMKRGVPSHVTTITLEEAMDGSQDRCTEASNESLWR